MRHKYQYRLSWFLLSVVPFAVLLGVFAYAKKERHEALLLESQLEDLGKLRYANSADIAYEAVKTKPQLTLWDYLWGKTVASSICHVTISYPQRLSDKQVADCVSKLDALESLSIEDSSIVSIVLENLPAISKLQYLAISVQSPNTHLNCDLTPLKNLCFLSLSSPELDDSLVRSLANSDSLEHITVSESILDSKMIEELTRVRNLQSLQLVNCKGYLDTEIAMRFLSKDETTQGIVLFPTTADDKLFLKQVTTQIERAPETDQHLSNTIELIALLPCSNPVVSTLRIPVGSLNEEQWQRLESMPQIELIAVDQISVSSVEHSYNATYYWYINVGDNLKQPFSPIDY